MIRVDRFAISKGLYAVRPDGLHVDAMPWSHAGRSGTSYWIDIDAAWFRRRRGVTVACVGRLRGLMDEPPANVGDALVRMNDGRYGGSCDGRWDGQNYWGSQVPDTITRHLEMLRPMLDNYPAVPDGHDGWFAYR